MSPQAPPSTMTELLKTACSERIVRSSVRIALVVGTVLNLINQGPSVVAGTGVSWLHVALNYLVPYCVASYSAAKNTITQNQRNDTTRPPP